MKDKSTTEKCQGGIHDIKGDRKTGERDGETGVREKFKKKLFEQMTK